MNHRWLKCVVVGLALLAGCGPSAEAPRPEPPASMNKDQLFRAGHQLYLESRYDSAATLLQRASVMDSAFIDPVRDLAQLHYEWAMRAPEKSRERTEHLRAARTQFVRLESLGERTSDVYERLCEISMTLNDDKAFVRYAKKNAELFPYDRQYFNLARAYFEVEDFQNVIKSTKESIEKFKTSPYVTSYYRLLGRSYMKIGRDQTAERTLATGVNAAFARMQELRRQPGGQASEQWRRAQDDKINMLLALKQLHKTYRAFDKLEQVEQQLKEEGYDK
jgi:tetratricopeptide (TPR) repeat protein